MWCFGTAFDSIKQRLKTGLQTLTNEDIEIIEKVTDVLDSNQITVQADTKVIDFIIGSFFSPRFSSRKKLSKNSANPEKFRHLFWSIVPTCFWKDKKIISDDKNRQELCVKLAKR